MMPLVVNNPGSMLKLRLITIRDNAEQALKTLHKIGVLHVEDSRELKPVDRAAVEDERREVGDLLGFVDRVLGFLPEDEIVSIDEDVEVIYTRPFGEIAGEVKTLYNKTEKLHGRIDKLSQESAHFKELGKYLGPVAEQAELNLKDLRFSGDFVFSRIIVLSNDAYRGVSDELRKYVTENVVVAVGDETVVHAVAETRYREMVETLVAGAGGRILEIPDEDVSLKSFLETAGTRLEKLEQDSQKLLAELQEQIGGDLKRLVLLREALSAENERLLVLEKASEAKYVTLIEGWIPKDGSDEAIAEIREKIEYAFTDVREPERDEEPPVKFQNPKGFRPFQIVVNLFATPKYREWDPTPIISYSFAFFFGLMVCDVLYGIGIILMAKFLLKKFVDDDTTPAFKMFQRLLYICSGVAIVGGLLTGQYFGDIYSFFGIDSMALSGALEDTLQDPVMFIVISLVIGFIHVNIGHILAFIKAIKQKDRA
jgi:V/A-type H+-transporting ATPase subunit I